MRFEPIKISSSRPKQAWQAALAVPLERTLRLCRRAVFTRPIIVGVECLPPELNTASAPSYGPLHTTKPGFVTRSLP